MSLQSVAKKKLSKAAIETLAIIAYHQPVTRGDIEAIRGVAVSRGTLDTLLECNWIRPRGRRKVPGRPLQWGTSEEFLEYFGLENLKDLPGIEELKATGANAIGIDWAVSPEMARNVLGSDVTIQGNFDPSRLYAPIPQIEKWTKEMIDRFGKDRYIVNLGHGILPTVPVDHARAFINAVKNYS